MTAVTPEAVTAGYGAYRKAWLTRNQSNPLFAENVVRDVLEAAAPHIRAQVYAEIRQLAAESGATYEVRRPCSCGASHCRGVLLDAHAQFADLIPVGETDG